VDSNVVIITASARRSNDREMEGKRHNLFNQEGMREFRSWFEGATGGPKRFPFRDEGLNGAKRVFLRHLGGKWK